MTTLPFVLRSARPEDARAIAEVHVRTWNTTYADIFPAALRAEFPIEIRERTWNLILATEETRSLVFVAEAQGEVVGFVQATPSRTSEPPHDGGEIMALYVLDSFQEKGLGRALFDRGVVALREKGFTRLLVWVAEGNRACGFYERLGGVRVARKSTTVPGGTIHEIAYFWNRL